MVSHTTLQVKWKTPQDATRWLALRAWKSAGRAGNGGLLHALAYRGLHTRRGPIAQGAGRDVMGDASRAVVVQLPFLGVAHGDGKGRRRAALVASDDR